MLKTLYVNFPDAASDWYIYYNLFVFRDISGLKIIKNNLDIPSPLSIIEIVRDCIAEVISFRKLGTVEIGV